MTVNIDIFNGTRSSLLSGEGMAKVENIVNGLVDLVGPITIDDEGEPRSEWHRNARKALVDVARPGWLRTLVDRECSESNEVADRVGTLVGGDVPNRRSLGSVHLVSIDGYTNIHLRCDEWSLAPVLGESRFGNTLSIEHETAFRERSLAELGITLARRVFGTDLFEYGYCCLAGEYEEKNIDWSDGGMRAVGLDAATCLPGFYWGNFFGSFLCNLVGHDVLMDVPGCRSFRLKSGVFLVNECPPDHWREQDYRGRESSAATHIGEHLFFKKGRSAQGTLFS